MASGVVNIRKIISSWKLFLLFIVTYPLPLRVFDLPGLTPNSRKRNFRNSSKSVSLTIAKTRLHPQCICLYFISSKWTTWQSTQMKVDKLVGNIVFYSTRVNENCLNASRALKFLCLLETILSCS